MSVHSTRAVTGQHRVAVVGVGSPVMGDVVEDVDEDDRQPPLEDTGMGTTLLRTFPSAHAVVPSARMAGASPFSDQGSRVAQQAESIAPLTPQESPSTSMGAIHQSVSTRSNAGTPQARLVSPSAAAMSTGLTSPRSGGGSPLTHQKIAHGSVTGQLYYLSSHRNGGMGGDSMELGPRVWGARTGTWVLGELTLSEDWIHFLSGEGESFAHATAAIESVNVMHFLNFSEHCCFELVIKEPRRESARELRKKRSAKKGGTTPSHQSQAHSGNQLRISGSGHNSNARLLHSSTEDDSGNRDALTRILSSSAMHNVPGLFWSSQAESETGSAVATHSPTGPLYTSFSEVPDTSGGGGASAERIVLCALDMQSEWEWLEAFEQFLDLNSLTRAGIAIPEKVIVPADVRSWAPPNVVHLLDVSQQLPTTSPSRSPRVSAGVSPSVSQGESMSTLRTPFDDDISSSTSTQNMHLRSPAPQPKGSVWGGAGVGSGIDPKVANELLVQEAMTRKTIQQIKSAAMSLRRALEAASVGSKSRRSTQQLSDDVDRAMRKCKALLSDLAASALEDHLLGDASVNPATPSFTHFTRLNTSEAANDIFAQLDRYHRAASKELSRVELELVDLYPTTRECRGSRPMDQTLAEYTTAYATLIAQDVQRRHAEMDQPDGHVTFGGGPSPTHSRPSLFDERGVLTSSLALFNSHMDSYGAAMSESDLRTVLPPMPIENCM